MLWRNELYNTQKGGLVHTDCNTNHGQLELEFQGLGRRKVTARFDGGYITSDAGALLLREVEARLGILSDFASCFRDLRDPSRTDHSIEELVAQRLYALALGYEDLADHDRLRRDPLLALLAGKEDPTGASRARSRDRGCALAGKSTLNRLELSSGRVGRYHRTPVEGEQVREFLVRSFIRLTELQRKPKRLILDLDATDDPVHGEQEGRFFHGYYGHYCYLPLYIFCNGHPLCAKLRSSNIDACEGSVEELDFIISRLRKRWPKVKILIRADSGFCREKILSWCEKHKVDYIVGLAQNVRLKKIIGRQLQEAKQLHESTGRASRVFASFPYRTKKSWSCHRRVIAKAEHLDKGSNPRFIVTSLKGSEKELYEDLYCARGEMENRIKEQQLDLFGDRTSTHWMASNQLRLWCSTAAYILLNACRVLALKGTLFEKAQCGTIRLKLLKIGALISFSVRRIHLSYAHGYPWAADFIRILGNLKAIPLRC